MGILGKVRIERPRKVFFGWWTVLGAGLTGLWGYGSHSYSFGAFLKPIAEELGMSRAVTSAAASLSRLEGGIEGPVAGWLTDRYGPRIICLFGIFLGGLGFVLMYFINSVWEYFLVWALLCATGFNIGMSIPIDAAIANWFVKKRGLALGLMRVPTAFSGIIVVPLLTWIIIHHDWRIAMLVGGVVFWLIGLPVAWFLIRPHRPEYYGLLPDGQELEGGNATDVAETIRAGAKYAEETGEVEFTVRQAMKTSAYWIIIVAHIFHLMVGPTVSLHFIPFLTDMGVDPIIAATALGLMTFMSAPGRFLGGLAADRVSIGYLRFLMAGAYASQCIGLFLLILWPTASMAYVYMAFYGLGMGISIGVNGPLRGRYFGRKGFATIGGSMSFVQTPIGIIAPIYAGWTYDVTGSYISAFRVIFVSLLISVVIMCFAKPPKPPADVGDIAKFV